MESKIAGPAQNPLTQLLSANSTLRKFKITMQLGLKQKFWQKVYTNTNDTSTFTWVLFYKGKMPENQRQHWGSTQQERA